MALPHKIEPRPRKYYIITTDFIIISAFVRTKCKLSNDVQCVIYSSLLSLPLDVTDLLLEYVASDPKAILNLRQVCSVTKGWIDSLSVSQSRRIFSKIPIYLNLNYNDLEKFDACPPPPSTCALKLQVKVRRTITVTEHMELMKNLRTIFPSFFAFWRIQMVTLSVENYSSRLLDTLGPPKSLRELICTGDMSETHPSLLQLETIEFEKEPSSIKFFRHVVRSRNLKCLSVKIRMYRLFYEIRNSRPYDQLERLQIILDAKRNDKYFHLDIHIDPQACHEQEEDKLQLFITTFGESASSIRMFNVPNGFAGQVSKLITTTRSPIIDKYEVSKKFFNSIHSYAHKGELSEVSCLIMERHFFGNLKTLRLDIPEENQENFTRSEQLIFPSGIESIEIISEKGLLVPRNLPGSLKTLVLQRCKKSIWGSDFYTTGIELGESLSLIRRSCPFLEELRIRADISEASFGPPLTSTLEDTHGAFESKSS